MFGLQRTSVFSCNWVCLCLLYNIIFHFSHVLSSPLWLPFLFLSPFPSILHSVASLPLGDQFCTTEHSNERATRAAVILNVRAFKINRTTNIEKQMETISTLASDKTLNRAYMITFITVCMQYCIQSFNSLCRLNSKRIICWIPLILIKRMPEDVYFEFHIW